MPAFAALSPAILNALPMTALALTVLFFILAYLLRRVAKRRASRLANTTILIIRHSEKPVSGRVLNREGRARAHAYAHYFAPFQHAGQSLELDILIAGADSKRSIRPRLTLEPLSRATGLPIDATHSTNDSPALAKFLRKTSHGKAILICWRHNQIPILLAALGADPSHLLPAAKWPTEVYDWVILLQYDAQGKPSLQQHIHQPDHSPIPQSQ
jgi:hypothetical protein